MAQGLRLHHPTQRACVLLIPHPGDPATGRRPKTYHVELDGQGDVIVSETVWRRLEEARAAGWPHGLMLSNVVGNPPKQTIDQRRNVRRRRLPEHLIVRA